MRPNHYSWDGPHFLPVTRPEGHEAAFVAALAEELSKPEYNQ